MKVFWQHIEALKRTTYKKKTTYKSLRHVLGAHSLNKHKSPQKKLTFYFYVYFLVI